MDVTVPDLGDFSDVEVIEVLVAAGDDVAVEDGLVTLETDKAAMDVPASHAGRIVSVEVSVGDTVSEGDVVAVVEAAEAAAAVAPLPGAQPALPVSLRTRAGPPQRHLSPSGGGAGELWLSGEARGPCP